MKVITITNQKGGCGKTTTAHAVADGLARRGLKVLAIDLDKQCDLSRTIGANKRPNATDLFDGEPLGETVQRIEGLDFIAGSKYLAAADKVIESNTQLRKALKPAADIYDYCIIDTPPTYGALTINSMTAADFLIIPVEASPYSVEGAREQADTVKNILAYNNKDLKVLGILITNRDNRTRIESIRSRLQDIADKLDTKVFDFSISMSKAVKDAQEQGQSIFKFAPKSKAAQDYEKLIDIIIDNK